jgi:hypothetical protein
MFKENKDGQTHSFNDGCGNATHNCNECQFENGEHSQACSKYKDDTCENIEKLIKTNQ